MTTMTEGLGIEPEPAPAIADDLAVRVRALRRARRDAQIRASRVRRVLLAPTAAPDPYANPRGRPRRHGRA
ncbi:hypothetical protein [Actinomadura sp. WAC 06369]|uniref:hypothetical protein n=1 Tax=Actinomadura sp. WAC 06369 TaxID=2203193 RepID=UPI000F778843|nr:hypothetical protein [Actinomadura sp. WAC 06369]RSN54867.1 hypothetical protein DMH08_26380 [Actinomadura sp. WAC 06369]